MSSDDAQSYCSSEPTVKKLIKQLHSQILTELVLFVTESSDVTIQLDQHVNSLCSAKSPPAMKGRALHFTVTFLQIWQLVPTEGMNKGTGPDPSVSGSGHLKESVGKMVDELMGSDGWGPSLAANLAKTHRHHGSETHLCVHVLIFIALLGNNQQFSNSKFLEVEKSNVVHKHFEY